MKEKTMQNLNNLIPYSLGIVAVNKDPNSDIITALPTSIFPLVDGEVVDQVEDYESEIVDSFGRRSVVKVQTSNTITAKWICRDPNVKTAPDVRRGAEVQLYRKANTDYFYWETTTNTNNFEKLEEKVIGFSNTRDENVQSGPDTDWTQMVSTRRKKAVLINTTKSDGEKWAYHIGVDAKEGRVDIKDDIGNFFFIDSANSIVRLQTAEGAFIEINKRNINIRCDNISTQADSNVSIKAGNNISEESTRKHGEYAAGWNTMAPTHAHEGNYGITGGIFGQPGGYGSGMEMQGVMKVRGDVIVNGIAYSTHRHREQGDGNLTNVPE